MKREILNTKRKVSGCCPGHDQYPDEAYKSRRSVKARARGKQKEHQHARSIAKRSVGETDSPQADAFSVFTVGHEKNYDLGIEQYGDKFQKLGRTAEYSGGFAARTAADAERLIDERGEWAVYALDADWDRDTVPSEHGWWHALVNTSRIICKIKPTPIHEQ